MAIEECYQNHKHLTVNSIEEVIKTYRSDFLEGTFFHHATTVNDWVLNKRQYYQRVYFELQMHLGDHYLGINDYEHSLKCYKSLLLINPLHELTYYKMMKNRIHAKDRVSAINYYNKCKKVLREELNIDPNHDLQNLYDEIIRIDSSKQDSKSTKINSTVDKSVIKSSSKIIIEGTSYFDYEFVSRLVDRLVLHVDANFLTEKECELIYCLKSVYPQITDYISVPGNIKLEVKHDIGIYYGLITLLNVIKQRCEICVVINEYVNVDLPSKKLISALEKKLKMTETGLFIY